MEQEEGYKRALATVQALERQLNLCDEASRGRGREKVEREIDEHFAMCINALAARKEALLNEVALKFTEQTHNVEETRKQLIDAIGANKQMLHSSSAMYSFNKQAVDAIWQGISMTQVPNVVKLEVFIQLPHALLESISAHGTVLTFQPLQAPAKPNHFTNAENVTTLAGSVRGKNEGTGSRASFNYPWGICFNPDDKCLYVCDGYNHAIRKVTLQGNVSTLVSAHKNLSRPMDIAFNHKEKIFYISNHDSHTIAQISASGIISILAGSDSNAGFVDGTGLDARFNSPMGVAVDQQSGTVFVCDHSNSSIRKITPQGEVSTLAGGERGMANANGKQAKFYLPHGICFDGKSNSLLVCDWGNNSIRRVLLNGDVSTVCNVPHPVSVAVTGNFIFVGSDSKFFKIVQKGQGYEAIVLAGSSRRGHKDGKPNACELGQLFGVEVHEPTHSCYVTDYDSHTIRRISFTDD